MGGIWEEINRENRDWREIFNLLVWILYGKR
jgi:hypothetical protein